MGIGFRVLVKVQESKGDATLEASDREAPAKIWNF